ncbi:MAG: hypothetical protein NTW48_09180 [Chloroflexi bacterium]|nr:hypothetical protein [Chloroflexota bacterium]
MALTLTSILSRQGRGNQTPGCKVTMTSPAWWRLRLKVILSLLALEKGWDNDTIAAALKAGTEKVEYVPNLALRSEYMHQLYTRPRSLC